MAVNLIEQWVAGARAGTEPRMIARMPSGWLLAGATQPLRGYCVLIADPIVPSLNALGEVERVRYSLDAIRAGDALLAVTAAARINYETLANADPSLHTHIIPRYADEPEDKRKAPPMVAYDWAGARAFDPATDGVFLRAVQQWLLENS